MRKETKKIISVLLIFAMIMAFCQGVGDEKEVEASSQKLSNPRWNNGVSTWDCVYFGKYWQSDTNNDKSVNEEDKKQLIKWRVLSVNGNDAFLLSDKNLEDKPYNLGTGLVTIKSYDANWENCTLRSWLNGYDASANQWEKDYSGNGFLNNAFSDLQQSKIYTTNVNNDDNSEYGTDSGNDTTDKIYLLSANEVMNDAYGFSSSSDSSATRDAQSTDKVKNHLSIRTIYTEYNDWWLRTSGQSNQYAAIVTGFEGLSGSDGCVLQAGGKVGTECYSVRPALHLNINSNVWSYAGTVSSDGTVVEPSTTTHSKKLARPKMKKWRKTYDSAKDPHPAGDGVTYTIRWGKVKGTDGYQVQLYETSTNTDDWYKYALKYQKKRSASISFSSIYAIKAKVRAYKMVNGKRVYGKWSKVVKKKVRM